MTSEDNREMTDADREEVLRLVLSEAGGADVARELSAYPVSMRSKFRSVVREAGLVQSHGMTKGSDGEMFFTDPASLTERGRKRLDELNARRSSSNGRSV